MKGKRNPRGNALAAQMLGILEAYHPIGIPTRNLAAMLFDADTYENREKVRRLARTLRAMGYFVYSFAGLYKLCTDPNELAVVFERSVRQGKGIVTSADNVALGIGRLGDEGRAAEAKRMLKEMLLELAEKIG